MNDAVVTPELIERLKAKRGAWTMKSLAYLGGPWPPKPGWKHLIIGYPRRPLTNAPNNIPPDGQLSLPRPIRDGAATEWVT